MLTRRTLLPLAAAAAILPALQLQADDGFITITDDGEFITSPMPPGNTMIEVKLRDGSITRSWFDHNIMEAGDFDFMTVNAEGDDAGDDTLRDQVVAWRPMAD